MKLSFSGKVLMIGFGSVAQCTLPLLLKHLDIAPNKITVLDFLDKRALLQPFLEQGVQFVEERINRENLNEVLARHVTAGDMIVDLAWGIDCCAIVAWCYTHNVHYINTSVEVWDIEDLVGQHHTTQTLYWRHMNIRKMIASWPHNKGATAVLDHGANPGLVSHFAKQGLVEIAEKILQKKDERQILLEKALVEKNFAKLSQLTGVKVIHISERDTQLINLPKKENEFVNTWSVMGFYEEGIAPAELGWGTHEKTIPANAYFHPEGPGNQICFAQMGIDTYVRSWVPCGEIIGMVIRHGEAFTLSDYLTVWENGSAVYRPTVHYAYCPADYAMNSLHELKMRQFALQKEQRIVNNEVIDGRDELGTLLMGHDFKAWWVGSVLDIHQARKLAPGQNATTVQVACSVISAITWMLKNPNAGVNVPDNLPYEEILKVAKPYLGEYISKPVDWTPLRNDRPKFLQYAEKNHDEQDAWQFSNFLY